MSGLIKSNAPSMKLSNSLNRKVSLMMVLASMVMALAVAVFEDLPFRSFQCNAQCALALCVLLRA